MERPSALLVVKDTALSNHLTDVLTATAPLQVETCSRGAAAVELLKKHPFKVLFVDLAIDDLTAVQVTQLATAHLPALHVIVGGAAATAQDVISAIQAGAADFILDPDDSELVQQAFAKAASRLSNGNPTGLARQHAPKTVITQDKTLLGTLEIARKVAPSTASVLITGESGTGKELLADFIHRHSDRKDEPYVAINCAALPEQLAESELFGHEKGAFTGAVTRKIGKFESAAQGSLVLDEITEMALPLQAKLLRVLQEREIVRLGNNKPIPIDARVVAISNRNMKEAVRSGAFREDLYFRLNVIPLTIPPLRERKNDIPLLADYFFQRFCQQNGKAMTGFSDEAMDALMRHAWPGNVRELENTIQRAVLIGSGDTLLADHLIIEESLKDPARSYLVTAGMTVKDMEKELIFNTLNEVNDNRTHAAKMLGISIRTLRNKLNEYRTEMKAPAQ